MCRSCFEHSWKVWKLNQVYYFSTDFSHLEPLCSVPTTQADATQLSLGRQIFCLEVGTWKKNLLSFCSVHFLHNFLRVKYFWQSLFSSKYKIWFLMQLLWSVCSKGASKSVNVSSKVVQRKTESRNICTILSSKHLLKKLFWKRGSSIESFMIVFKN